MSFRVNLSPGQTPAVLTTLDPKQPGSSKVKTAAKKRFEGKGQQESSPARLAVALPPLQLTNMPQEFFSCFPDYDSSRFQPKHIDHLQELMKKNILGGYVHFSDVIGLDCLETLEKSRLFLSAEAYKNIEEAWISIYMQWIFGSLRTHLRNEDVRPISQYSNLVFVFGRSFLDILSIFTESLYKEIDKELEHKLASCHSKVLRDRLRAEAANIPQIKQRWQINIDVITAIMSSPDRGLVFFKTSLHHFDPHQGQPLTSLDQAQNAMAAVLRLCKLFERGLVLNKVEGENIRFFHDILRTLEAVAKATPKGVAHATSKLAQELKDKEVYLELCGQTMAKAALTISSVIDQTENPADLMQLHKHYEMQIFHVLLNYYSEVMINKISAGIDVLLLPQISKDHVPRQAWIDRAFNGVKSILEKDIPIALIKATVDIVNDEIAWKKHLSSLRLRYSLDIFENEQLLSYLENARYEYGYLRLFFDKGVSCFSLELKKILAKNMQAFEQIVQDFQPPIEELIEETVWLAKLLFLQHDLNVLIGEHDPKEEEEILEPYLRLLDRIYYQPAKELIELELLKKAQQEQADLELKELLGALEHIDLRIGPVLSKPLPLAPTAAVTSLRPLAVALEEKSPLNSSREVTAGKFTKDEAEAFKHWKNASVRMVEKKLQEIGLQFLRQKGSHRQYGLVEDKSVRTTLAAHPGATVHPSILRKIVQQVGVVDSQ